LKNILFLLSFISLYSFATTAINISNEDLYIESNKIEILKEKNEIHFLGNLKIANNYMRISAEKAEYNSKNKILNIVGNNAEIISNSSDSNFTGHAKKIIVYNNNSIELSGDAYLENDGIKFKSSSIRFNQKDGRILN